MLRDSRGIIRRLEREGFELVSVSGSHRYRARAIYRDAGWEKD
jgi:predicted RNA binding protein YcfA (HicA-like mRNA interferase family)